MQDNGPEIDLPSVKKKQATQQFFLKKLLQTTVFNNRFFQEIFSGLRIRREGLIAGRNAKEKSQENFLSRLLKRFRLRSLLRTWLEEFLVRRLKKETALPVSMVLPKENRPLISRKKAVKSKVAPEKKQRSLFFLRPFTAVRSRLKKSSVVDENISAAEVKKPSKRKPGS